MLPDGWVFHEAENASGYAKGMAAIKFDWTQRHSSLAYIAWDQDGMTYDLLTARAKFPLKAAWASLQNGSPADFRHFGTGAAT